jgi:nitrous oxide reductase
MRVTAKYPTPGSSYAELNANFLTPGKSYTALVKRKLFAPQATAAASLTAITYDGAWVYTASPTPTNASGTADLRVTFTVPAGVTQKYLRLYNGGARGDVDVFFDDLLVVEVPDASRPYTGPYFDGDSENGAWNGVPHASTSTGWIRR